MLTAIFFQGCGNSKGNGNTAPDAAVPNETFPYVTPPMYITDPVEEVLYLSEHFWDNYIGNAKKDTALLSIGKEEFRNAYAAYIQVLGTVEPFVGTATGKSGDAAKKVIGNSHKEIFAVADSLYLAGYRQPLMGLIELSEAFLYNPNSPYLNEELYIPAIEAILALKSIDSLHKMQHKYQQMMVMLNRKGTKANDFKYEYLLHKGTGKAHSTLHKTKAEYLLIYFNNPGCASCKEIQQALADDPIVNGMIESGKLKVLSMYIDKDEAAWRERFDSAPSNWIYARDYLNQFEANELYGIRAIPSMYLLNSNKEVLLKDAQAIKIIEYFNRTNRSGNISLQN